MHPLRSGGGLRRLRVGKEQNIGLVAEQAGNSPEMIKKHYRRPLMLEEGEAWFNIRPQHGKGEQSEVA